MSPLLWESFILFTLLGLVLVLCYVNFLIFEEKSMSTDATSYKLTTMNYKW